MTSSKDCNFFIPVEISKGYKDDEGDWIIEGIASTEHLDLQKEIVNQNGIDFSYF